MTSSVRCRHAGHVTDTLTLLEQTIAERMASGDVQASYVAQLHARGLPVVARKLGEEAVETIVAALSGSEADLVGEAADVVFHLAVLLAERSVPLSAVMAELDRRHGTSGITEKAARTS
nr:phosphoribosyl-ATP diphosphatase [Tsuneonella aeria]